MCFRPSALSNEDSGVEGYRCATCGMLVNTNDTTCPYCGDPIPPDTPDDFSEVDPSYSTRVL